MINKKIVSILLLIAIGVFAIQTVNAALTTTIVSPSSGWNNNFAILLNVTTSDFSNVTFNTTSYTTLTTLYTNLTQGNLTLNSTYLAEGNTTIYVYATNSTNTAITATLASVANVAVDTTAPPWTQIPTAQTVELGNSFSYDVNATDAGIGISTYFTNDTTNFATVAATGVITNTTALTLTGYGLNISVNDSLNNINSTVILITVSDTTVPTFVQLPNNQTTTSTSAFSYDINGSDADTVTYYINDTTNFAINGSGVLTNATVLTQGTTYQLNVTLNDSSNNPNSTLMSVAVSDTTAPTWDFTPANQTITAGNSFTYDVNASDNVAVSTYFINDTARFTINSSNGTITSDIELSAGTFWLNVSVNDTSNNVLSTLMTVTVNAVATSSSSGGGGGGGGSYSQTTTLSSEPKTTTIDKDDKVSFDVGGSSHKVQLTEIYGNYVTVTVSSTPILVSLFLGVTEKVDVDNDNILDLAMTLEKIYTKSAKITFEKIAEEVPQSSVPTTESGTESTSPQPEPVPSTQESPESSPITGAAVADEEGFPAAKSIMVSLVVLALAGVLIYFILAKGKKH